MPIKMKKQRTNIIICIDSSGSMSSLEKEVVDNYNNIIKTMAEKAEELEQDVSVGLMTFGGTVETVYDPKPIALAPKLTRKEYVPDGGTPLFDCMADAVEKLQKLDGPDVANLVTVITDGYNNINDKWNAQKARQAMDELNKTDRWTFTFLAPDAKVLTNLGIPKNNVQEWEATTEGVKLASTALSTGYANYLTLRSTTGQAASKGFFLAAVDQTKAAAAKRNLTNVAGDFHCWPVTRAAAVSDFVYSKKVPFRMGAAFYQLTKKENVQHHKEVLLREKASGRIYGGKDARAILGLPEGVDVKVVPSTHGDWDIFVQSTSNNRKLVPGTEMLYLK